METGFNESKLCLIIRKPQSGKTFICIKDIETSPTDLHIVMTMNTIKSNKQFLGRVIENIGPEHIIIYNSDRKYEVDRCGRGIDDGCYHCHNTTDTLNIIRNNTIHVIIMCSHKVRWGYSVHEIVTHLEDSKKFGVREISFHSDENHAYINKNRENIEQLLKSTLVRQFRMYSATPFPIWTKDEASIWNKIYIINVEDMYNLVKNKAYFGVKDCEFIPSIQSDETVDYTCNKVSQDTIDLSMAPNKTPTWIGQKPVFDLGNEIKYIGFIRSTLYTLDLAHNTFSFNFIPSYKRKITQYEIMKVIHSIYHTANVIIMNGNETGMKLYSKYGNRDCNIKILEPSKQIEDLLNTRRSNKYTGSTYQPYKDKPTFIVGFQTCNMSVTLINEEVGNFDNMIFYHDHLINDPECLYQMMRIVFSYIHWDRYNSVNMKKTKIYGHPAVYKIIIDYEQAIEQIESLEEGEYLQSEICGDVPIKQNKKKKKTVNYLQQISEEFIDYEIQNVVVNSNNESKKWDYVEDVYSEFIGKSLYGPSDPRNKRTGPNDEFILNGSMGGKYKGKHVDNTDLSSWAEGLSWYSNYAIKGNKYKYIRLYVGYKDLEDPTKYTIYIRTTDLTQDEEVTRLLKLYEDSDN